MSFKDAISIILRHEGGYVNDPNDPGGETKYGISKRSYPEEDIKNLTEERAKLLYLRDFWKPLKCDSLPLGVAVCLFDFAVNSGKVRAIKALQNAIGTKSDGIIGPETINIILHKPPAEVIQNLTTERILFYAKLKTWAHYGRGWTRRTVETLSYALTIGEKNV